jgi:uncharacterized damage-inducible protein DinB
MFSIELVRDLYAHMEWADSLVWQATLGSPDATADQNLRDRLMHIHMTQRAFLQVWTKQTLDRFQSLKFATTGELYAWIRPHYPALRSFLASLQPAQFTEPTPVPWAKYFVPAGREAAVTTLGETMFQVFSHTTYHRGQVNSRLRALGAEPPLVDYIGWVWLGRPATSWPAP